MATCVSSCGAGKYRNGPSCASCHPACRECRGPSAAQCIDPTPHNDFTDADCADGASRVSGLCSVDCEEIHYKAGDGSCQRCDISCRRCRGPDADQCLSCNENFTAGVALLGGRRTLSLSSAT